MASKNKQNDKPEQLAKRTTQIIGFGFAISLTITKLGAEIINGQMLDIPWYVVIAFFGFGVAPSLVERFINNGKN